MNRQVLQRKGSKRVKRPARSVLTPHVYRVVVEPDDGRFYAEAPALPGCHSWGRSYAEALKNIKEAIELWLEVKKEEGEPIPVEKPQAIRDADLTVGVFV